MAKEIDNRHATDKTDKLIEKALARQPTEMFTQFNNNLMQFASAFRESLTKSHSHKINPFKVKMNLDILNLEGNIDAESIDNWVQQLESYYSVNQLSEAENITIESLKMPASVHYWWENISQRWNEKETP